jgi:hypothetical protein
MYTIRPTIPGLVLNGGMCFWRRSSSRRPGRNCPRRADSVFSVHTVDNEELNLLPKDPCACASKVWTTCNCKVPAQPWSTNSINNIRRARWDIIPFPLTLYTGRTDYLASVERHQGI